MPGPRAACGGRDQARAKPDSDHLRDLLRDLRDAPAQGRRLQLNERDSVFLQVGAVFFGSHVNRPRISAIHLCLRKRTSGRRNLVSP